MAPPPNPRCKPAATPQRCLQDICGGPTRGNSFVPSSVGDIGGNNGYNNIIGSGGSGPTNATSQPPPLPPRPATTTSGFMNTSSGYNYYGLGGGSFGPVTNPYFGTSSYGYGAAGGYGRMPYAASPFYGGAAPETGGGDFVRVAEEQSRNAFQSIETVVQAFSSISMMLESTLNALYSSFRAVLGVAEQFSRLRLQLSHVFTTLAVVRFIRWLWRRILSVMRLRRYHEQTGGADDLWRQAASMNDTMSQQDLVAFEGGKARGHWSSVVFFAIVLGGPYLIWKLVSKLAATVEDQKRWATGEKDHFVAVAQYDFEASSGGELSIRAGQRVRLAPKELQPHVRGWILGSVDGRVVGLIPANYIKVIGKQTVTNNSTSTTVRATTTKQQPIEKQSVLSADDRSSDDAWNKVFEDSTGRRSSTS